MKNLSFYRNALHPAKINVSEHFVKIFDASYNE